MAFIKRAITWQNNDDVLPADLNRYEDALEEHEEKLEDMTKVEESEVNGNIQVNDIEVVVYRILNDLVNSLDSDDTNKGLTAAAGKLLAQQIHNLSVDKLSSVAIPLTRIEATPDYAIYTIPVDIVENKIYYIATGASPNGTVTSIIIRTNLGDYTLKIANTNVIDTMKNARWGDFNAGVRAFIYFGQRNGVLGAVITQPSYGTTHFATMDKGDISFFNGWGTSTLDDTSRVEKLGGTLYLMINATGGTITAGTTICTTPVGFRPLLRQMFIAECLNNSASLLGRVLCILNNSGNLTFHTNCPVGTTFIIVK